MVGIGPVFALRRPSASDIRAFLASQGDSTFSYPEVGATRGPAPTGYTVDRNRVQLGCGGKVFRKAVEALRAWQMFALGWVELHVPGTAIAPNSTVAVLVEHFGFWSLNAARVIYVIEEDRRYAFAYGTLQDHAEMGEERFSVEWSPEDDAVWYDILAFSRPRQWQARIARPISRRIQKRFADDSKTAMTRAMGAR